MRSPVQIWVAAPTQSLGIIAIPRDFAMLGKSFPLFFSLLAGNLFDERLHSGGAGLLHFLGDVAVYVQREGRSVVA